MFKNGLERCLMNRRKASEAASKGIEIIIDMQL